MQGELGNGTGHVRFQICRGCVTSNFLIYINYKKYKEQKSENTFVVTHSDAANAVIESLQLLTPIRARNSTTEYPREVEGRAPEVNLSSKVNLARLFYFHYSLSIHFCNFLLVEK